MEWIAGGTLRARLGAHPDGLPAAEVAATADCLLTTLAFLHARGIVHGDLHFRHVLIADGSKLGQSHLGVIGAVEEFDQLVTGGAVPPALVAELTARGLDLLLAEVNPTVGRE